MATPKTKEEVDALFVKCRLLHKGARPTATKAKPKGVCMYLGEPVKDEAGQCVKKACVPCGGKARQAFKCSHELTPDVVTLGDCAGCRYHVEKSKLAKPQDQSAQP